MAEKKVLFGELKRTYKELAFQREIRNACESLEIDVLGILQKHRENLWVAAAELVEKMDLVKTQGFYQGMIHEVREVAMKLGVPDEELLLYERTLLGLVETFPGSNVFIQSDQVENYRRRG